MGAAFWAFRFPAGFLVGYTKTCPACLTTEFYHFPEALPIRSCERKISDVPGKLTIREPTLAVNEIPGPCLAGSRGCIMASILHCLMGCENREVEKARHTQSGRLLWEGVHGGRRGPVDPLGRRSDQKGHERWFSRRRSGATTVNPLPALPGACHNPRRH